MNRRTTKQWLELFYQHKISSLTQTAFAKNEINPTNSSYRKRQLLALQHCLRRCRD
ncbi:hypothetical protein [Arsukibacterium sp. MJ3]|uniref:hypothetical protein n=1 Tax=Arsukibacterium sp. MJ3 TaxID=1632859 RepID=UPI0013792982|nr:hypothetical protein [Arsukibacterium sp. MJ3]